MTARSSKRGPNGPTVLVDMDGVLADYWAANNQIVRDHHPEVSIIDPPSSFYVTEAYAAHPEVVETIKRETRRPGFFEELDLISGAITGWQRIIDLGYTPRVCSSPLENHPTVIEEKKAWLRLYFVPRFGEWVVDTAIFDRDKSQYDAIAIIDDRPEVRGHQVAHWQHIMFTQPYNQHVETDLRLSDWHDPTLEALLARASRHYRKRGSTS